MTDQKKDPSDPSQKKPSPKPLSIVGWTLGALSLVSLVHDLGRVELYRKLKDWVDAYSFFVGKIGKFLFGWIRLWWFEVSPEEHHVLVLASVSSAAVYRAQVQDRRAKGVEPERVAAATVSVLFFLAVLLVAVILPGWYGIGGSAAVLLFFLLVTFVEGKDPTQELARPEIVKQELIGIFRVFLVVMAVNFSLFHT